MSYICVDVVSQTTNPIVMGNIKQTDFTEPGVFIKPPESEQEEENEGLLSIKVQANGPLIFRGDACVQDSSGQQIFRKVGGLCRCEKSSNRPFCDGTHSKIGFVAE